MERVYKNRVFCYDEARKEGKVGSKIMERTFTVTGACNPQLHYMVDLQSRLEEIKVLVEQGAYFTINRARQYGKTTMLTALKKYLQDDYIVVSTDFQLLSNASFENEDRKSVV